MSEHESTDKIRMLINITDAENSDCVTNAGLGLNKLKELGLDGKIMFVNSDNHAYLIPNSFPVHEKAINPPTKVAIKGQPPALVQFDDYTIKELLNMVKDGRADDITHLEKYK